METLLFCMTLLLCTATAQTATNYAINSSTFRWSDAADTANCTSVKRRSAGDILLIPKFSKCSPHRFSYSTNQTWLQSVLRTVAGSPLRLQELSSRVRSSLTVTESTFLNIPLAREHAGGTSNYIIEAAFGSPPRKFYPEIDTGSDISWIPCSSHVYKPENSSTSKFIACDAALCAELPEREHACEKNSRRCEFSAGYLDGTVAVGPLLLDTLTLASKTLPLFAFGCGNLNSSNSLPATGIIGLARGNVSLLSQTANLFQRRFFYCLPSYASSAFTGSLVLGQVPSTESERMLFTPILTNKALPTVYYMGLQGISIAGEPVSIPPGAFSIDDSDGRGAVLDSGTVVSFLVTEAYNPFRDAFVNKTVGLKPVSGASSVFDTCFELGVNVSAKVPVIVLKFQGELNLTLSAEQTMIPVKEDGSVACLAFLESSDPRFPVSIIGNFQQQEMLVYHDVLEGRVGFSARKCGA